jgi:hypothetical protein
MEKIKGSHLKCFGHMQWRAINILVRNSYLTQNWELKEIEGSIKWQEKERWKQWKNDMVIRETIENMLLDR